MRAWGRAMRASRTVASSRPRCTPSACTAAASSIESFTMKGTPAARHTSAIARAWTRRAAPPAALARYCTSAAPPAMHSDTRVASCASSGTSGVTAYRPRSRSRSRLIVIRLLRLARPEEPVGQVLSHAGPEGVGERLPRVVLGFVDRIADLETAREVGRQGGGERAPGAVEAAGKPLPGLGPQDAAAMVER